MGLPAIYAQPMSDGSLLVKAMSRLADAQLLDRLERELVLLVNTAVVAYGDQPKDIRHAMDAGAIGTTIGRNIWEHESPARVVAALAAIVHEDASVDVAMRQLEPSFAVA